MPRENPPTVAITHEEHGRLVINEDDLSAWRKKGWSVEGEDAPSAPADGEGSGDGDSRSSDDGVTVKQAAEVISGLDSADEVAAYVEGDGRKGVAEAVEKRLEELSEGGE
jgi:hypothetical protein